MANYFNFPSVLMAISCLLLAGCSDSKVEAVKKDFVDGSRTTTFSNLLDNRQDCESITWSSEKDEMQRDIVRYECVFKESNDFLGFYRNPELERKIYFAKQEPERKKEAIEHTEKRVLNEIREAESAIASIPQKIEEFKKNPSVENDNLITHYEQLLVSYKNKESVKAHEKVLNTKKAELLEIENNLDNTINGIKEEYFSKFPIYEKGSEQYVWIVNENLEPTYAGAYIVGYADRKPNVILSVGNINYLFNRHSKNYNNMYEYLKNSNIRFHNVAIY